MRKFSAHPKAATQTIMLSGWKDIATYLGKGVRTAQRYERQLNLPVHRPAGNLRGSVVATKPELDEWVAFVPLREVSQLPPESVTKSAVDMEAALNELRLQMVEFRRLRKESSTLRSAFRESMALLRKNLESSLADEPSSARRDEADVLSFPSKNNATTLVSERKSGC